MSVYNYLHMREGNFIYTKPLGINGEPVIRTRDEYPYSYDAYITYGDFNEKATGSVYSDRLYQWDYEKHNKLCQEIFGNTGQDWSSRSPNKIELFLQKYFDNESIKLIRVFQGCNVGNGYPYWYFEYKNEGEK